MEQPVGGAGAAAGSGAVTPTRTGHHEELAGVAPRPAPSPGAPGSPTPGRFHEGPAGRCRFHGEEEGAAAAGPWLRAARESWQSSV